jgi:hypothetical protein
MLTKKLINEIKKPKPNTIELFLLRKKNSKNALTIGRKIKVERIGKFMNFKNYLKKFLLNLFT